MVTHHFHAHTVDNNLCSYTELKKLTLAICREGKERVCGKLNRFCQKQSTDHEKIQ